MTTKKTPLTNGRNGHVSLAREEYDAFLSREEVISELTAENAKLTNHRVDASQTLSTQAKHLSMFDLQVQHLERISGLQNAMIDILRNKDKVASLEEMTEFWRQWVIYTENAIAKRSLTSAAVAEVEPNLFKMWRNWIHDRGKQDRSLAATRAEHEAAQPQTQRELQEHMIRRQREENHKLGLIVKKLEAEIEALKAGKQP